MLAAEGRSSVADSISDELLSPYASVSSLIIRAGWVRAPGPCPRANDWSLRAET